MLKKFNGEYVAVYGRRVIDHDKGLSQLTKRVRVSHASYHVLVEYVTSAKTVLVL